MKDDMWNDGIIKRKNALGVIRTRNRLLRKQVLYPLSYESVFQRPIFYT